MCKLLLLLTFFIAQRNKLRKRKERERTETIAKARFSCKTVLQPAFGKNSEKCGGNFEHDMLGILY